MIIEDIAELKVLVNVFYALKFGVDNVELSEIVRSPLFSRIFNDAVIEMHKQCSSVETIDGSSVSVEDWKLSNREKERQKILKYLNEIESWKEVTESTQVEIIKILLNPFIFNNGDVKKIKAEVIELNKKT